MAVRAGDVEVRIVTGHVAARLVFAAHAADVVGQIGRILESLARGPGEGLKRGILDDRSRSGGRFRRGAPPALRPGRLGRSSSLPLDSWLREVLVVAVITPGHALLNSGKAALPSCRLPACTPSLHHPARDQTVLAVVRSGLSHVTRNAVSRGR